MWTIVKDAKPLADSKIDGKCGFDPKKEETWKLLKLNNSAVLNLVSTHQQAGLGDREDAYFSIIPPLSKEASFRELLKFLSGPKIALEEQSKGDWESAYNVYHLLFQTFIKFGVRDRMATRATALLAEFFRFLSAATRLQETQVEEEAKNKGLKLLKEKVLDDLKQADGDVISSLVELYKIQGWSEDCKELNPSIGTLKHPKGMASRVDGAPRNRINLKVFARS